MLSTRQWSVNLRYVKFLQIVRKTWYKPLRSCVSKSTSKFSHFLFIQLSNSIRDIFLTLAQPLFYFQVVESLFKAHSDVQTVLQVYRDMQGGGGPSNGSGYSSGSSMPTLPVSARMVPTTSSYGPSYGQSARINTGPAPLLDLDEDVGNPLLLAASSKQTAQKASSVPAPGRPTSQPRSTVPAPIAAPRQAHTVPIAASPNPAPATLTATADLLGDPFAPVPAPAQRPQYDPFADPFGGSSSIDSLLGPANATTNNAPSSQPARSHPVDPFL